MSTRTKSTEGRTHSENSAAEEMRVKDQSKKQINDPDRHPDPITKAPGSHPIGTGVGALAGGVAGIGGAAAAGAIAGTVVGPIGAATGAAIGAVVGGLVGKGVAEGVNPTLEHEYWRETYQSRPYFEEGFAYEEYSPAYQFGWESQRRFFGKDFDEVEADLARDWEQARGQSRLDWTQARGAARDAWDRARPPKDNPLQTP